MTSNEEESVPGVEPLKFDSGWGWIIVISSFMIHFIMDGITYSMGQVFLEPMMMELSDTRASVGSIFSILPAVTLGVGPIVAVFTNIYGCRAVTIAGACIASFGFFLSGWWANIWFYYVTIGVIAGSGFGLMYLPALLSVKLYFNKKRGRAIGIAVCGSGVGTFVLSYIMNEIVNLRSWINYPTALLVEAGIILVGILCGSTMIYRSNETSEQRRLQRKVRKEAEKKQDADHPDAPEISNDNTTDGTGKPLLRVDSIEKLPTKSFFGQVIEEIDMPLLKNVGFTLFAISNFLSSLGFNVVYNFADDLANDAKVIKDQRAYIVMSIGLSNIFGRVIIGSVDDQKWVKGIYLFILTLIISGVATMIAPLCDSSVIQHIGYASFFGFFSGGSVALTPIILTDIVGEKKLSNALGLTSLFIGVAVAIGTPVVGGMRDAFSHFARPFLWPYLVFGGCTVFSGIILFPTAFLLKQKKQSEQQMEMNSEAVSSGKHPNSPEQ